MANPCGADIPPRAAGDSGHIVDHNKLHCDFNAEVDARIAADAAEAAARIAADTVLQDQFDNLSGTVIEFIPTGSITGTDVQSAIAELAAETAAAGHDHNSTYVPGTDRMWVESDYNAEQTLVAGAGYALTTLTFDTPYVNRVDSFELGTKGIKVLAGTMFGGRLIIDITNTPGANAELFIRIHESLTDGDPVGQVLDFMTVYISAGTANPYLTVPFWLSGVTPGRWICVKAKAGGANLVVDSFGGMDLHRLA